MTNSRTKRSLLYLLIITFSLSGLSACSLLGAKDDEFDDESVEIDLPDIQDADDDVPQSTDSKGMTDREKQYLNHLENKLSQLQKAWNNFVDQMPEYADDCRYDGKKVTAVETFTKSRADVLNACSMVEVLPLSSVPHALRPLFDHSFLLCNHIRAFMYQVVRQNCTNLPEDLDIVDSEAQYLFSDAKDFIDTASTNGPASASNIFPPVDWEAEGEKSRKTNLESTFNALDLGLIFGSTRADVMGVEGLIKDYDKLETLSYNCDVYVYKGVRRYHFNEYDQMYGYTYELTPNDQNPYIDLAALHKPVMHDFYVEEYFFQPFNPQVDAEGYNFVTIDRPSCTVTIKAMPNDPAIPVTIDVVAKEKSSASADSGTDAE